MFHLLSSKLEYYTVEANIMFNHSVYHRDNAKFCSCGGDRQVYYWDVSTGRVIRKFRGHDGEVNVSTGLHMYIDHFLCFNKQ